MTYEYRLFWKQKLTWLLIATSLISSAAQIYLYIYIFFIKDGEYFTGYAPYAVQVYDSFFFFRGTSFIHVPIYALWIYKTTNFYLDIKYCSRMKSRFQWLLRYLCVSSLLAVTFLILINIPAIISSYIISGVFWYALPYYLYSFILEFILHMILSLLFFVVYVLTDRTFWSVLAVLLYGAWDALFGSFLIDKERLNWLNLNIGWGRAMIDTDFWIEEGTLDWSAFFVLAGICLLFFLLCQLAVRRKDFLSVQENLQKA